MNSLFIGFYLGSLFMIILYNLQWYINRKELSYLYYSLFQIFMILIFLQVNNIIHLSKGYLIINAALILIFILLFSKEFLELKKYLKNINKTMNIIILFIFVLTLYSILSQDYAIFKQSYSLLFFPLIPISYYVYKKGFKPALYYIIAWSIYILFIFISDLSEFYNLQQTKDFPFSSIGNLLQSIILSYALSNKTKLLINKQKKHEQMLIHQNRLASLGEMLTNISHQYRQPLNRIASYIMNMQMYLMKTYKNETFLLKELDEIQLQLEYMSHTIDDFSNFYTKDKYIQKFNISEVITTSSKIIDSTLKSSGINLLIYIKKDYILNSYPKELSQVILNILQNAKDALVENNILNPEIKIILNGNILSIEDNAKGISKDNIKKVFDAYFSTKKNGSGIGLYMSKMILNKNLNADIKVNNVNNGANFEIKFF